jgi:hypothetical protein
MRRKMSIYCSMCIKINKVGKQEVGTDSYFLFADVVDFYTHWTYMLIFRRIFLSNYWWQESDIWSQASYRYAILWEAFLDPSDSYFLFADLGSRNLRGQKTLPTTWGTYMKLVTKYQISAINSYWEKCDAKSFNVHHSYMQVYQWKKGERS